MTCGHDSLNVCRTRPQQSSRMR